MAYKKGRYNYKAKQKRKYHKKTKKIKLTTSKIAAGTVLVLLLAVLLFPKTLPFETISKGQYSGYAIESYFVINDYEEWNAVWSRTFMNIDPAPPVPEVGFPESTVIAVFLGQKNTGGYGIEIIDVSETSGKAVIKVIKSSPPKGSMVAQALTQPYHLVKVPKIRKPNDEILFEISDEND